MVKINIEASGRVLWNSEDQFVPIKMEQRIFAESQKEPQAEIHIRPDRGVAYKHVATVLATSQRLGF